MILGINFQILVDRGYIETCRNMPRRWTGMEWMDGLMQRSSMTDERIVSDGGGLLNLYSPYCK